MVAYGGAQSAALFANAAGMHCSRGALYQYFHSRPGTIGHTIASRHNALTRYIFGVSIEAGDVIGYVSGMLCSVYFGYFYLPLPVSVQSSDQLFLYRVWIRSCVVAVLITIGSGFHFWLFTSAQRSQRFERAATEPANWLAATDRLIRAHSHMMRMAAPFAFILFFGALIGWCFLQIPIIGVVGQLMAVSLVILPASYRPFIMFRRRVSGVELFVMSGMMLVAVIAIVVSFV